MFVASVAHRSILVAFVVTETLTDCPRTCSSGEGRQETRKDVNELPDTTDANHGFLKVDIGVDAIRCIQHCLKTHFYR